MLKYLCLIVLFSEIYGAPLDDTYTVNSHDNQVVTEAVEPKSPVPNDEQKTFTTTKSPKVVEILESGSDRQSDGSYSFHYRGADGTFREETAVVKNPGSKKQHLEINGAYSFLDTDGKEVIVHYQADNRGFVPVGNNIPDAISLSARENSQLPAVKNDDDDENEDDDVEDSDVNVLIKRENN